MADVALLERLCTAQGISGDEGAVRELILEEIRPCFPHISALAGGRYFPSWVVILPQEGSDTSLTGQ